MNLTSTTLPDDIEALKAMMLARDEHVTDLQERLSSRESEIEHLKLVLAKLRRMQLGRRSEKLERQIKQLELRLEYPQAGECAVAAAGTKKARQPRESTGRKLLPDRLEREERVIRHRRPKLACSCCDCIVQAAVPSRPIDRGVPGQALLPHLTTSKFAYQISLYRQSVIYARDGRPSSSTEAPAVRFAYSPARGGEPPQKHLAKFTGILQADGFTGDRKLYEGGRVQEVACRAHPRRKIHDVHVERPTPVTTEALERISALYRIGEHIRGRPPEERQGVREAQVRLLLDDLKRWSALVYYCSDGQAEIDNLIARRALRGVAIGRRIICLSVLNQVANARRRCTG